MTKFVTYLEEAVVPYRDGVLDEFAARVISLCQPMGNSDLVWRGLKVKHPGAFVELTNDREGFRGKMDPFTAKVIAKLDLGAPIFCTMSQRQAKFFGSVYAVVPEGDVSFAWNPEITDLVTAGKSWESAGSGKKMRSAASVENDAENTAKGYKHEKHAPSGWSGEIIMTAKSYIAVSIPGVHRIAAMSKFCRFSSPDDVKTYRDLAEIVKTYQSYLAWKNKH